MADIQGAKGTISLYSINSPVVTTLFHLCLLFIFKSLFSGSSGQCILIDMDILVGKGGYFLNLNILGFHFESF